MFKYVILVDDNSKELEYKKYYLRTHVVLIDPASLVPAVPVPVSAFISTVSAVLLLLENELFHVSVPVSYTHLTLPTICSV